MSTDDQALGFMFADRSMPSRLRYLTSSHRYPSALHTDTISVSRRYVSPPLSGWKSDAGHDFFALPQREQPPFRQNTGEEVVVARFFYRLQHHHHQPHRDSPTDAHGKEARSHKVCVRYIASSFTLTNTLLGQYYVSPCPAISHSLSALLLPWLAKAHSRLTVLHTLCRLELPARPFESD